MCTFKNKAQTLNVYNRQVEWYLVYETNIASENNIYILYMFLLYKKYHMHLDAENEILSE